MKLNLPFGFGFLGLLAGACSLGAAWQHSFDLEVENGLQAGLEGSSADSERFAYNASASAAYVPVRGQKHGLSIGYGETQYDWSDPVLMNVLGDSTSGEPFGEVRRTRVGFESSRMYSREWGLFARGGYSWNVAESDEFGPDANASDGGTVSAVLGATWMFGPKLIVSGGVAFSERLEESELLIPLIFLRWKIDDHWTLTTARGVTMQYDLFADGQHRLFAGVSYGSESFAIAEVSGVDGASSTLVGSTEGIRLIAGYERPVSETLSIKPYISYDMGEEVEFRAFGRSVERIDFENRLGFGLRVSGRF